MAERSWRWYISRDEAKRSFLNITSTVTAVDTKLDTLIESASRWIEEACRTYFYPVIETRYYDHPDDATILKLDQWLLDITTFTTSNGDETVSSDDYFLKCGDTYNLPPYDRIVMKSNGDRPNLQYSGTLQQANAVTGPWGYSDSYENTDTTLAAAITDADATTFTSSSGSDLEIGWMALIDDEQLFISGISSNTVTVKRGMNGTDAATHDSASTVNRCTPPLDIEACCGMLVARFFHRGSTSWSDTAGVTDRGMIFALAIDMPAEAANIIERYRRRW